MFCLDSHNTENWLLEGELIGSLEIGLFSNLLVNDYMCIL